MILSRSNRYLSWLLVPMLTLSTVALIGCGESTPPATKPDATSTVATPAPPPQAKGKAKGKKVDPTADMDRDEIRAYRKQQREQGKTP